MRTTCTLLLTAALLGAGAPAQEEASTLLEACRRADVVVHATVVAATDPSPDWHRLQFRVEAVLAGQVSAVFDLLEPSGACCGRSLFALQPNDACLLFLQRTGPTLHPFAGSRGVLPAAPSLLRHVQDLLAAGNDQERLAALLLGLQDEEPRIHRDAALTLAALPSLTLDGPARVLVAQQLQLAVTQRRTTTPALADIAVRSGDATLLQSAMQSYLDAPAQDQAAAVRRSLLRATPGELVQRLLPVLDQNAGRQVRAAELLAELPIEHAMAPMRELLREGVHPRVKLCVAEAMLGAGHRPQQLEGLVPPAVLRLAEQRRAAPRSFRSVSPHAR